MRYGVLLRVRLASLLIAVVALAGCRRQPLRAVRIGIQDNVFPALALVAKGEGFFEDAGLDVTIKKYPSGKLALNAALAGEVELCTVADMPIMVNSFTRDDFRILCSMGYTDNGAWIIARRDHGIDKAADLRGKTIGTQEGSAVHFFLSAFLVHNRIPASDVTNTFMPATELPGALSAGTIDAFSMRNPYISEARTALGDNAIEFLAPYAYRQFHILVIRKDVLDSDPSVARDIVAALVRAETFVLNNRAAAVRAVVRQLGPERESEVASDWDSYTFVVALGQGMIRCLEDQAGWAVENGRTGGRTPPAFLDFIAPAAIKAVRPESFSVIE